MPFARVRVRLYGTSAQLTSARTQILAQYPNANRIFDRADGTVTRIGERFTLTTDVRLKTIADGTALRDKLASIVSTLRTVGVMGRITYHLCTHLDAIVEPCATQAVVI